VNDSTNSTASGLINGISGLLSKAADTAIDVWAIKESGKTIGTFYASGQTDPAKLTSASTATTTDAQKVLAYAPYLLVGGIMLVIGFGVIMAVKSSRK
jgi:hypothetical protein